ncbi:PfkB family carbohydrate kinase [Streptomyces sp. NPDC048504]|uniref:PfkB family carbohydrate kinase n=1 Tax=Streptomyces sp. NPDC048504 TaxID=3365559 RepID=UPI003715E3B3
MPLPPLPLTADRPVQAAGVVPPQIADVVCVGETMAVLSPPDSRPFDEQPTLAMAIGGAESNVACGLAGLGHRAAWLSRLGDDPFARRILTELTARGIDVTGVETDPARPTGVYFKDPAPEGTHHSPPPALRTTPPAQAATRTPTGVTTPAHSRRSPRP